MLLTSSRELDLFCFMPGRRRHRSWSRGGSAARLGPRSRNSAEARCGEEEEEPPATMIPCTQDTALDTKASKLKGRFTKIHQRYVDVKLERT